MLDAEQLNREPLSTDKINRLKGLAKKVGVGLELANDNFTLRKVIIDLLVVKVGLIREEDNKAIAFVTCFLKDTELILATTTHSNTVGCGR